MSNNDKNIKSGEEKKGDDPKEIHHTLSPNSVTIKVMMEALDAESSNNTDTKNKPTDRKNNGKNQIKKRARSSFEGRRTKTPSSKRTNMSNNNGNYQNMDYLRTRTTVLLPIPKKKVSVIVSGFTPKVTCSETENFPKSQNIKASSIAKRKGEGDEENYMSAMFHISTDSTYADKLANCDTWSSYTSFNRF